MVIPLIRCWMCMAKLLVSTRLGKRALLRRLHHDEAWKFRGSSEARVQTGTGDRVGRFGIGPASGLQIQFLLMPVRILFRCHVFYILYIRLPKFPAESTPFGCQRLRLVRFSFEFASWYHPVLTGIIQYASLLPAAHRCPCPCIAGWIVLRSSRVSFLLLSISRTGVKLMRAICPGWHTTYNWRDVRKLRNRRSFDLAGLKDHMQGQTGPYRSTRVRGIREGTKKRIPYPPSRS